MRLFLFALLVAGAILPSCGDNNGVAPPPAPHFPRTLTLTASRVEVFEVYEGSPAGAVPREDHGMEPGDFWAERMESYPPAAIRFDDATTMSYVDKWTPDTYKFEEGRLYRKHPRADEWIWSGTGTDDELDYHVFYYYYLAHAPFDVGGTGQRNDRMTAAEYFDMSSFTDPRDVVAVCNIIYTYKAGAVK
jgi:hypothetical protein